MKDAIRATTRLIESLAPAAHTSVPIRTPLVIDECCWFLRAVSERLVVFNECPTDCFRLKKWDASGPDHFETPAGRPRHLFSKPVGPEAWLNREYVPHIAAFALAISELGYDPGACSFSRYRKFERDLILRRAGTGYETDAEFYDNEGRIHLQIEAKASERQTTALASAIERHGMLIDLPASAVKEVEYVLDLAPRYLWVVGPGSVDPPAHVYSVALRGPTNASFTPMSGLPDPPHAVS